MIAGPGTHATETIFCVVDALRTKERISPGRHLSLMPLSRDVQQKADDLLQEVWLEVLIHGMDEKDDDETLMDLFHDGVRQACRRILEKARCDGLGGCLLCSS